jgi:hypothetical protein
MSGRVLSLTSVDGDGNPDPLPWDCCRFPGPTTYRFQASCITVGELVMAIAPDETFDVFLSHAHSDAEVVEELGVWLTDEARLKVWLDKWVLVPGEHWQQGMARGLDQARTCAVCVGVHTPKGWFREEIERALNRQTRDSTFRVIPVILPGGSHDLVGNFLELRTWIDFKNGIHDHYARHILVSGIKGIAPGRNPYKHTDIDTALTLVRAKLVGINILLKEQLIDNKIALEFQQKLIERYIEL